MVVGALGQVMDGLQKFDALACLTSRGLGDVSLIWLLLYGLFKLIELVWEQEVLRQEVVVHREKPL